MSCLCCLGICLRPYKNKTSISQTHSISHRRSMVKSSYRRINKTEKKIESFSPKKKKILYTLKDKFRCLFCGGRECPNEDYLKNPTSSIEGLNCNLIDNSIYASQRPSNYLIEKYNLINIFKEKNIGLIINVQRPGEHPYCGKNTLDEQSGFSYTPSLFSSEGIIVKLYGWKDMDVPDSLYFMLDIVKEMLFTVNEEKKKVLVHCHSGKGRTGIVIACYLMFKYHINAFEAVKKVRDGRKGAIQNNQQMKFCVRFYQFLSDLREVFTKEKKDVFVFIKHQNDLLLKSYNNQKEYESTYIPFIIPICLSKILEMKNTKQISNLTIYKALNGTIELNDEIYSNINSISKNINSGNWNYLKRCQDIIVISELLFIWFEDCVNACIFPSTIKEIFSPDKKLFDDRLTFTDYILEYKHLKKEIIFQMYQYIKSIFKKYEWELIKLLCNFFREIYPVYSDNEKENNNLHNEYKYMIEKIVIFVLGYNIDMLYENEEENKSFDIINLSSTKSELFQNVKMTVMLFKFIRDTKTKKFSTIIKAINSTQQQLNIDMYKLLQIDSSLNNPMSYSNISNENIVGNQLDISRINNILSFNNKSRKEKGLYKIYQTLKNHFEKFPYNESNSKNNIDDKSENSINNIIKIERENISIFNNSFSSFNESINSKSIFSRDNNFSFNDRKIRNLSSNNLKEKQSLNRSFSKNTKKLSLMFRHFISEKNLRKRNTKNLKLDNSSITSNKNIHSRKSSFYMPEKNKTQIE